MQELVETIVIGFCCAGKAGGRIGKGGGSAWNDCALRIGNGAVKRRVPVWLLHNADKKVSKRAQTSALLQIVHSYLPGCCEVQMLVFLGMCKVG